MPSNKDLIIAIGEEATAKGVDIPDTEGKSNADLAGILKELKAKEPVAPTPPPADDEAADKEAADKEAADKEAADKEAADKEAADKEAADKEAADADASRKAAQEQARKEAEANKANKAPPPPEPAPYTVATGKAITCKKGVLGEGEEIKEAFLAGGKKDLDNLVKKGFVVKN